MRHDPDRRIAMEFRLHARMLKVLAVALLATACGEDIMQPDGEA